jgi:hypothetical protein
VIRAGGGMDHTWPCPASVGHTTCTCRPEDPFVKFHRSAVELWEALVDALRLEDLVAALEDLVAALSAFLVQPGRHRGQRQPVSLEAGLVAVAAVELVGLLVLVGVLS